MELFSIHLWIVNVKPLCSFENKIKKIFYRGQDRKNKDKHYLFVHQKQQTIS